MYKDLNAEHALRAQSYALANLYRHTVATMIPWKSNYKFCEAMFSSEDVKSEYVVPAALKKSHLELLKVFHLGIEFSFKYISIMAPIK